MSMQRTAGQEMRAGIQAVLAFLASVAAPYQCLLGSFSSAFIECSEDVYRIFHTNLGCHVLASDNNNRTTHTGGLRDFEA